MNKKCLFAGLLILSFTVSLFSSEVSIDIERLSNKNVKFNIVDDKEKSYGSFSASLKGKEDVFVTDEITEPYKGVIPNAEINEFALRYFKYRTFIGAGITNTICFVLAGAFTGVGFGIYGGLYSPGSDNNVLPFLGVVFGVVNAIVATANLISMIVNWALCGYNYNKFQEDLRKIEKKLSGVPVGTGRNQINIKFGLAFGVN